MITNEQLQVYAERYVGLEYRPLRVEVVFANPPAGYNVPHLDGILASTVVREATNGAGLPSSAQPYFLPVPLRQVWTSAEGLPLWAATDFQPIGRNEIGVSHWAKRLIGPELVKMGKGGPINLRGTEGKWKESLIPLPVHEAVAWWANCEGNAEEIGRLLGLAGSVGKKRSQGHGVVMRWRITKAEAFSFWEKEKLLRPLPGEYAGQEGNALVGWTPPYWLPATQAMCVV